MVINRIMLSFPSHRYVMWQLLPYTNNHAPAIPTGQRKSEGAHLVERAVLVVLGEGVLLQEVVFEEARGLQRNLVSLRQRILRAPCGACWGKKTPVMMLHTLCAVAHAHAQSWITHTVLCTSSQLRHSRACSRPNSELPCPGMNLVTIRSELVEKPNTRRGLSIKMLRFGQNGAEMSRPG